MTLTWVLQQDSREHKNKINEQIHNSCSKYGYDSLEIYIVPFERSVVGGDPIIDGPVIPYGSTAMLTVSERCKWKPGVFRICGESETKNLLGVHYLNSDMVSLRAEEVVPYVSEMGWEYFFAKPDHDLKNFDGTVFDIERFPFAMEHAKQFSGYEDSVKIVVSSLKQPENEYRFIVVDNKVITGSQYRSYRKSFLSAHIPENVLEYVSMIADKFNPGAPIYSLDVCSIGKELKVIEYNTFNHSGLYECDIEIIVKSVSEYIMDKL